MQALKIGLFIILFLTLLQKANSQDASLDWAVSMGGKGHDNGHDISIDGKGNIYVTGPFYGRVDFNPGTKSDYLMARESGGSFVQKLDAEGNFIWAKSIGGTPCSSVAAPSGEVCLVGTFRGTADFNPGALRFNLNSQGEEDVFVQKLDADGNLLWAKSFGGPKKDWSRACAMDADGNIYIVGFFQETVDFNSGLGVYDLTAAEGRDFFVLKLDARGNFIWVKSMGSSLKNRDVKIDLLGNVYVTGYFWGKVDFDPGEGVTELTSGGGTDVFVQKLDAKGNFLWVKSIRSASGDWSNSMTVDAKGNVYVTGGFEGTADFDPSAGEMKLKAEGKGDIYILKLDANGNFIGAKSMGGQGKDVGTSIGTDISGNVYLTGSFQGTADFGSNKEPILLTSNGDSDVFILKLDAQGKSIWVQSIGDKAYDAGLGIITDASNDIYLTGTFQGTIDLEAEREKKQLISAGYNDVFVLNINQNPPCTPTKSYVLETACGYYRAADGKVYTSSGKYVAVIPNYAGCDSTINIKLTIEPTNIDTSIRQDRTDGIILSSNAFGRRLRYQWMSCASGNEIIEDATTASFRPTENGQYAVEISNDSCSVISACVEITTIKKEVFNLEQNKGNFNSLNIKPEDLKVGDFFQLKKLYFSADSTAISRHAKKVLLDLFSFLQDNPSIAIEVAGHTNGLPPDEFCDELSTRRARNVAQYLIHEGVDKGRISYKGYGKRKPIGDNNTKKGQMMNQRVEVVIIGVGD